jgi:hypothetical protein
MPHPHQSPDIRILPALIFAAGGENISVALFNPMINTQSGLASAIEAFIMIVLLPRGF